MTLFLLISHIQSDFFAVKESYFSLLGDSEGSVLGREGNQGESI